MPRHASKYFASEAKEPKRVKRPPPPVSVPRIEPLSDAEELALALALVLWKSLRCHGAFSKNRNWLPTHASAALGEKAIRLAKLAGVKAEFLALLFEMRLVKVTLTRME